MRSVFIGSSALSRRTAQLLLGRGHEVVMIERQRELIGELAELLDCALIHGDGTKPAILREADPPASDLLFCLTGSDESNILASLVGRSLGFRRVITRIEDPEFEHICIELGLEDTIIPNRTTAAHLADLAGGRDVLELSALIGEDVRFFAFVVQAAEAGPAADIDLPRRARIIYLHRGGEYQPCDADTALRPGDEVVVVCHRDELDALRRRWGHRPG